LKRLYGEISLQVDIYPNVANHSYADTYCGGYDMQTVQMTLDEDLVDNVDRAARTLNTTRSGFTRMALQEALKKQAEKILIEKHRAGYARLPVVAEEFDVWEMEQAWGDE